MVTEPRWRRGVFIGLGANLGDPCAQMRDALRRLDAMPEVRLRAVSRPYRSPPWGLREQPEFTNAVAEVETRLAAADLLPRLLAVERDGGRERGGGRWGPRTIDLDLLLDGATVVDRPGCRVPHPRLHERAFVLVPLWELAPQAMIPGRGRVAALLDAIDAAERSAVAALPTSIDPRAAARRSSGATAR